MKFEQAGALTVFVAAGAVGAIGVYLAWGLISSMFHPGAPREAAEQARTMAAQPAKSEETKLVDLAPGAADQTAAIAPKAESPKPESKPEPNRRPGRR